VSPELSATKVGYITQDDQGFMWFGTPYGLYRFDGYNFKVFVHDPGNPNSLSGVFVNALFKDRNGMLWVGCDQFVNKLDPATETFTRYPVPFVNHISQDNAGVLWLSTRTGLYALAPETNQIRHYSHDPNDPSSLSSNDVKSSGEDKEGRFWVANTDGIDEFDRRTGYVKLHIPLHEPSNELSFYEDHFGVFWIFHVSGDALGVFDGRSNTLTSYSFHQKASRRTLTGITAMLEDRNGALWLGTHGAGLLKFDREHQTFICYRNHPSDPDSLPQNNVEALFADREGSIWIGLGSKGLRRFAAKPLPFTRFLDNRRNPSHTGESFVGAIYEDREGVLWVGTPETLKRIDRKNEHYTSYQATAGPAATTDAITIREDRSGNLWVGTYGQGLLRFNRQTGQFKRYQHNPADPSSLSDDFVSRLLIDHNGTIWAASSNALNRFEPKTERFTRYELGTRDRNPFYLELVEDREGVLWLGTDSSGLQRFEPTTGKVTTYEHDVNRLGTLSDNRVNSVLFDQTGTVWIGTQNGLDEFDRKAGMFNVYTHRDGLPGNAVGCVLNDDRGNLWMSTNNGISNFDPKRKTFSNYSTADGLPGPNLTGWGACFKSRSGEMFFGGYSGATAFFPDKVAGASYIPPVVLTDFRLSGNPVEIGGRSPLQRSISYTRDLTLTHRQDVFSLTFAALSYSNPVTNRYRYKLEGLESAWTEVGSDRRQATYTTLPAGSYTFRAQGATSNSPWSEPGVTLPITILPPWWGTLSFRAVSVATLGGLLWMLYSTRLRQLSARMHRRLEERERAEEVLRESECELRLIIETIPGLVWCASPNGELTYLNQRILGYIGTSSDELMQGRWANFLHPDDRVRAVEAWSRAVANKQPFEVQCRLRRADGVYRWVQSLGHLGHDSQGRPTRWYGLLIDIDDRKNVEDLLRSTQERLSRATQTATLGELSASIAHEINQPLTAVVTNGHACLRWLSAEPPNLVKAQEAAERVVRDGKEAGEVVRRVRALFRRQAIETVELDLNEVIGEVLHLLRGEIERRSVAVNADLEENMPSVVGDRVQLQQLILNLLLNGLEAMDPVIDRPKELIVRSKRDSLETVLVEIRDCGVGLKNTDRVFDAFFTTKEHGMGMGLTVCRSIVEAHNGRLWAACGDGPGTTFCFTLPVQRSAVP
jgi:PAS domain S-box-containing protein